MKFRIVEKLHENGSKYFSIERRIFFLWETEDNYNFDSLSSAIAQLAIYKEQYHRRKNPKVVFSDEYL